MKLTINGETAEWPADTCLRTVFERLGLRGQRVAVMVNGDVVTRSQHESFVVHEGDRIEILTLAGGG